MMTPDFILMNVLLLGILAAVIFILVRALTAKPEKFDYTWIKPVLILLCVIIIGATAFSFVFLWLPR